MSSQSSRAPSTLTVNESSCKTSDTPGKNHPEESDDKVQGGAAGGRHGVSCRMSGVSQGDTMESLLWRGTLGRRHIT